MLVTLSSCLLPQELQEKVGDDLPEARVGGVALCAVVEGGHSLCVSILNTVLMVVVKQSSGAMFSS